MEKLIDKNIKVLNNLSETLIEDVKNIREGKLDIKKASAINRHSNTTIKACVQAVLIYNHQEIQRHKIETQTEEQAVKLENIQLQRERILERQSR